MTKSSKKKYRLLLQISNAIMQHRTRDGLFREITGVLDAVFHFDHISILLKQPAEENSWYFFAPSLGIRVPGFPLDRFPSSQGGIPLQAMQQKKTIIADIAHEPHYPESEFLHRAGLLWVVCTPLVMWNTVIGSFQLCYKNKPDFSDDNIDMFEQVARQVALAVENMLAYEKLDTLKNQLTEEKSYLKKEIASLADSNRMVYSSSVMAGIMDDISNVASTDSTVLITGETGTGKDMIARNIHDLSKRSKNTFIKLNCAALVPTLIESELFGHEKGAFTGASSRKIGRFELADNSTLFLDEITELPLNTQAKLLQILQEGTFERVGGSETIRTNTRIIAATNQDLRNLVADNRFRHDLFYRLNIFPIHVPPLRDRREDIPTLGRYFGNKYCERMQRARPVFNNEAFDILMHYSWPGNVRELQNFMERVIILKSSQTVTGADIRSLLHINISEPRDSLALEAVERRHIIRILEQTRGVVAGSQGAASLLELKRGTLQYRMKKLGIHPADYR